MCLLNKQRYHCGVNACNFLPVGTQVDAVGNPVKVNKLRGKTNTTLAPVCFVKSRLLANLCNFLQTSACA